MYKMTSSSVTSIFIFFITGLLFSMERTAEAGTLHGNVGGGEGREEDHGPLADISCVLIYERGRISTEEANVCLPLKTLFNISCSLLEEPNTVIDRHRRSVAGSLRTEASNQYIDSSCQWENTDGKRPRCTLIFSGLYYGNLGEETVSIRANYKNIVKTLHFQIYDPNKAHPLCNPLSTTLQTTEPLTSIRMSSSRKITTTPLKNHGWNNPDAQSGDDEGTKAPPSHQLSWHIFVPVVVVVMVVFVVLLVVFKRRRRRTTQREPPAREEYEAVDRVELNENG